MFVCVGTQKKFVTERTRYKFNSKLLKDIADEIISTVIDIILPNRKPL